MAQLTLERIRGNTYLIPCPTNIGIYVENNEVTLIDTGLDKEMGKQILKLIEGQGWHLKNIVNTHSHADHIGGNSHLIEKTGCLLYAPKGEAAHIEDTLLEPSFLFGGYPHKILRNKFLMAKPSIVNHRIEGEGEIFGIPLTALKLPGHSMDMLGYRTPDGIVFTADALISEAIVTKYHIFYLWDVAAHLQTLECLKNLEAEAFVPSHGTMLTNIKPVIDVNIDKINEIVGRIMALCQSPITTEAILSELCQHYEIALNSTQYVLLMNTLKSYLSYLLDEGQLETSYKAYQLTWESRV